MFSRCKAQKLAEGFRQNDRRDMFFLYPCGGISLTTSRLRRSYGEARNRVPASRHTLLAHS